VKTLGLFAVAAAALAFWAALELRTTEPMVDLRTMRTRPVLLANGVGLCAGIGTLATWVLVPAFTQTPRSLTPAEASAVHYGFGYTATESGLLMLPAGLVGFAGGPIAGRMCRRLGLRVPLALGCALAFTSMVTVAFEHDHPWAIAIALGLLGFGIPMAYTAMVTIIVENVPDTETGVATGLNTVIRIVGNVVGAQVAAAILATAVIPGTNVPKESAFTAAFCAAAVATGIGIVLALSVRPDRRRATATIAEAPAP
jgi:MFS family permease